MTSGLLYDTFDQLLCPTSSKHREGCQCRFLEQHYGTRLFKCPFLHCEYRRHGFETKRERDSHTKYHDMPWKCDVASCEYAEIGFLSRRMRNDHLLDAHRPEEGRAILETEHLGQDDIHAMLFDLVRADRIRDVAGLMQNFLQLDNESKTAIRVIAAHSGSFEMLKMLCEDYSPRLHSSWELYRKVENAVIEGQNSETMQWLIEKPLSIPVVLVRTSGKRSSEILATVLRDGTVSIYYELQDTFVTLFSQSVQPVGSGAPIRFSSFCFAETVLRAAARSQQGEALLLELWKGLKSRKELTELDASVALAAVAKTSRSITLAEYLLENGADVSYRTTRANFGANRRSCQPLQYAAREDSAHAAEFLKFLLSRGADPSTSHEPRLAGSRRYLWEEKGPKGISKWFGVSWDDLVREVGTHPKAREWRSESSNGGG